MQHIPHLLQNLIAAMIQYDSIMKNVTPRQLARLAALFYALSMSILMMIIQLIYQFLYQEWAFSWSLIFLLILCNALIGYAVYLFTLENFIYRRIKLIYKNIHRLKSPDPDQAETVDLDKNILEEVDAEVQSWAKEKKQEIDRLEEMEVYRREFLGNVSHELKTPIYNIQGYLDTLIHGGIEDEQICLPYLNKAATNADRLNTIVQDLEVITRHEAGELQLNLEVLNIYDIAQEVMSSMEFIAAKTSTTLLFKDGSDRNLLVKGDLDRLRQVLTNLITNSLKYGKENGRTWVGIYDMDTRVLIEITDNGIGIGEKHLPRLFERFYRVDTSRTRKNGGGSGLGLAIVKHLIEAHQQSIHVRSKEGVGTTFGFTLEKVSA